MDPTSPAEYTQKKLWWVIPIALVAIATVAIVAPLCFDMESGVIGIIAAAVVVLWVGNIIQFIALRLLRKNNEAASQAVDSFSRAVMLFFKLGLIPFYIVGVVYMLVMALFSIHPVLFLAGWIGFAMCGLIGWLIMISGSFWGIACALSLYRQGRITSSLRALGIVAQFFFCLDVIAAIVLFVKGRNKNNVPSAANHIPVS